MLSSFLISQQFSKGAVDPTLFTRHTGNDILLVQIYVDNILFASTSTAMCDEFANQRPLSLKMSIDGENNRLNIGKCNGRIPRGLKPKDETFQVVLDALALTPCYPLHFSSIFKIDKRIDSRLTLEVFRDIFQIFPRVPGRDFDALPSEEDTISFLRDLGHTGVINSLNDVVVDQMHQPWRTFAALINRSLSGKTTERSIQKYGDVLLECLTSPEIKESKAYKTYLCYAIDEEPVQKGKRVKRATKKPLNTPATCIVIREPTVETKSKRKEKEKVDVAHGKGIELLSHRNYWYV
ncbi:hypothetical protein Tco_0659633 [Tanacetum coccineum]